MIKITKKITKVSVTVPSDAAASTTQEKPKVAEMLRLRLNSRATVADKLLWPTRPDTPEGTVGWTSPVVRTNGGAKFAVTVNYYGDQTQQPFEVLIPFAEAPRGLTAVARLLSFDMRTKDKAWLAKKLASLAQISGDPVEIKLPGKSMPITVGSPVAALARYVEIACDRVGYLTQLESTDSAMLRALVAPSEPKARHGDVGAARYFDVDNAGKGDDFRVFMAETELEDGAAWPHSVWLAGEFPAAWHGIAKLLSKDMQVADPAWIGLKLVALRQDAEPLGDFWAYCPITRKSRTFGSTLAFVAQSILARYVALGILDENGKVVSRQQLTLFSDDVAPIPVAKEEAQPGLQCPKCSERSLIVMDGCPTCASCGFSKCG